MNNRQELFLIILLLCLIANNNADEQGNFSFGQINTFNDILLIVIILGLFRSEECNNCDDRDRRTLDDEPINNPFF